MRTLSIALGVALSLIVPMGFSASITQSGDITPPSTNAQTLCPTSKINNNPVTSSNANYPFGNNIVCRKDIPYSGGVWGAWTSFSTSIALVPLCPSDYPYLNYFHEKWGGTTNPALAGGVVILWGECCSGPKTTMTNETQWKQYNSCPNG